ncbi:uncharacterized protein LOC124140616 [Haliotis rufescens]|uniref:uncharacterized protein LOC124140616 n=1 Tax=Haliotis rufescens TaxID=6454 RepID=UPI001EB00B38|nr:uncharacterized protein LOC124140616 [Haliotis rufescens]XP_046364223.2 uncharacterized protein LOC124140616 [Haliotis rufescens]
MAVDMSMTERLMRQKNATLQRQLEVTLRILDKEDRISQQQHVKVFQEYSHFLRDLSVRCTGLDTYSQPDTRAMRKNSALKDRRLSVIPIEDGTQGQNQTPASPRIPRPSTVVVPVEVKRASSARRHLSPERQEPRFTTCMEVLDDIIQNHSLRKKPNRQRKIGLIMPAYVAGEGKPVPYTPRHNEEHITAGKYHPVHIRPTSSYIAQGGRGNTDIKSRPHTAQPQRSAGRQTSQMASIPITEETWRSNPANQRPRRPKSAPSKYEMSGRSPAVPRQQVAGIMAEMKSRSAATRAMLSRSKKLNNYIASLAWPSA